MFWNKNTNIHTESTEEFFDDESFKEIKMTFIGRVVTIIIASLSLIAALAWEETLHDLFREFFTSSESIQGKLLYAILVTLLTVIVSVFVGRRFLKKARRK
ncbi:MAG: DUF5654 family protein [Candidatus Nomurabacteria bacterium]|nr:DUF5654 family protein [Candidatus Nomurabacteria bacterium]